MEIFIQEDNPANEDLNIRVNCLLIERSCLVIHWCVPICLTAFSLKFHTQNDLFAKHFAYNLK